MNILIGGDLVPTESNFELFNEANISTLIGKEMVEILNKADIRIFNLEAPITDSVNPIKKCGPNLLCPTSTIRGIKALNPSLITLANNHIMDQGENGLKSTEEILKNNNINYIGIGKNLKEASKAYIFKTNNIKIGVYACAENEFTIAKENKPGANPFDPLESLDHISDLKQKCDYVIVLYHGGKEHYRYPSPYLQKVCRKIVSKGANLVICQHSHCIGCFEEYNKGTIVYGQGNFLFDYSNSEFWKTSILINIELNEKISIKYIPICKEENKIRLANDIESVEILQNFNKRSLQIKDDNFINEEYKKFSREYKSFYLSNLGGYNRVLKKINNILKGKLTKIKYTENKLLGIKNFIECEAHRELLLSAIDDE